MSESIRRLTNALPQKRWKPRNIDKIIETSKDSVRLGEKCLKLNSLYFPEINGTWRFSHFKKHSDIKLSHKIYFEQNFIEFHKYRYQLKMVTIIANQKIKVTIRIKACQFCLVFLRDLSVTLCLNMPRMLLEKWSNITWYLPTPDKYFNSLPAPNQSLNSQKEFSPK